MGALSTRSKFCTEHMRLIPSTLLLIVGALPLLLSGCEAPGVGEFGSESPLEVIPAEVNFGSVRLGESATLWVQVRNRTDSALVLAPSLVGADRAAFAIVRQPRSTLAAGARDSLLLRFTPTEARFYQATLLLGDDHPVEVPLRGSGTPGDRLEVLAIFTSSPPTLDGVADDAVWQLAPPVQVLLTQVEPSSSDRRSFSATLRAAVDADFLYMLIEIADPIPDETPNLFRFQGGNPAAEAYWRLSTEGQDALAVMFPIGSPESVQGDRPGETFDRVGCAVACHPARSTAHHEGGSYPTTGRIDIWYWKAGTTNPQGYADDYVAEGRDGASFPEERRGDAGVPFAEANFPPRGSAPLLPLNMAGGDNGGLDPSRFLWEATAVPFNPQAPNPATGRPWRAGDVVPGWVLRAQRTAFASRGDVRARGRHANGGWTIELRRRLSTGNADDAPLPRGQALPFSLAYFDATRQYAPFEHATLPQPPRPAHFGPTPSVLWLLLP